MYSVLIRGNETETVQGVEYLTVLNMDEEQLKSLLWHSHGPHITVVVAERDGVQAALCFLPSALGKIEVATAVIPGATYFNVVAVGDAESIILLGRQAQA